MDFYHIAGSVNSALVLVSLLGVFSQLRKIWGRKRSGVGEATELLSLNQFFVSFIAYFAFFVYGYSIEPLNHYMVWTRLIAAILVVLILYEIALARRQSRETYTFCVAMVLLAMGLLGLWFAENIIDEGKVIGTTIMLAVSILLAQGYWFQIRLIVKSGRTGAVDLRMSQFIFLMDVSTIVFAFAIGLTQSWPMLCIAVVSLITKVIIMYLFYWVKVSPVAYERRGNKVA